MSLVKIQTALKNRTHAVLHRHGVIHGFSDLFGAGGRRYLSLLIAAKDAPLPESGRVTLKGYLQLLGYLRRQIASVTRSFRKQVDRSPAAMRLTTLPGISCILGYTILAEVGRIERFRSAKHDSFVRILNCFYETAAAQLPERVVLRKERFYE